MKIRCLKCNDIIDSSSSIGCIWCKCGSCHIDNIGNNLTRIGGDAKYIMLVYENGTEKNLETK